MNVLLQSMTFYILMGGGGEGEGAGGGGGGGGEGWRE